MGMTLRVATVNILNDLSRWDERRPLLVAGLASASPDLIAFQEVTDPLGNSTAHRLASELGGYSVHVAPMTGLGRRWEGVAVLSRLPVEGYEVLDLRTQHRVAQSLRVRVGGRPVAFINGHYYWLPGFHAARVRQVGRVLAHLKSLEPGTAVVACGDFNGTPRSPEIALMRTTLASAHEARHGREPEFTCMTPLTSGKWPRRALTSAVLRLFANNPGGSWRDTLDYIFVSPNVRVVECGVFLDHPSPDDPTLYASDHLGIAATLEIPPAEGP